MVKVGSLPESQEEADTRMFLHGKHNLQYSQENFTISSPNTAVFILLLIVSEKIVVNIHFKTGNKNKARIININKVKQSLKSAYSSVVDVRLKSSRIHRL